MNKILMTLISMFVCTFVFADGYFLQFNLSSAQGVNGTMKTYYDDGNSRTEVSMQMPGMGNMDLVTLIKKDEPTTVYMLNEKNKTYSTMNISADETWKDAPKEDYEVTVVGKEKVNGYNTTHIKVKRKGQKTSEELWVTKELTGYEDFSKMKTKYTGKDNMYEAMKAKGAEGFPVRIKTNEGGADIQIDLVKAEKQDVSKSLFSIEGYAKSAAANNPLGIDVQQLMQDMQNMSPEEQQKMLKELQEKYKQD